MKQTKFICLLLCIILTGSLFAGCNTAAESKNDVSENSVDENLSSPTENEATPWGAEEDWDFLKGWKVHGEFEPLLVNAVDEQHPHYSNLFKAIKETHEQANCEILIHVHILAFDLEEVKLQHPSVNAKQTDVQEVLCWFEAGNVPVKYENGVLHGDLSYGDVEKIIEYGKEAGYQLFFINYGVRPSTVKECLEGKDIFECPSCNNEE